MKAIVKKDGVLVPKEMLQGIKEVEIVKEGGRIILLPLPNANDPLFKLGTEPVKTDTTDGATQHDLYLYKNNNE